MAFVQFKGGELFVSDGAKVLGVVIGALFVLGFAWILLRNEYETRQRAWALGEETCQLQKSMPPGRCLQLLEERHARCFEESSGGHNSTYTEASHIRESDYKKCILEGYAYDRLRRKGVMGP